LSADNTADEEAYAFFKILSRKWSKMMEWLHGKQPQEFTPEMLKEPAVAEFIHATTKVLNDAVDEGLKVTPLDEVSVQRLQESNFVFSGYKTFHELNEAFPSLLDKDGNIKPFDRFLNDVQSINVNYNKYYLKAEYNFAVQSSLMAARWKSFNPDKRYNLQYRTVGDERVRISHRALDGITLPMISKFWDSYFPPNGWGCRCTVVQVRAKDYAISNEREAMNAGSQATSGKHQEMFRFNPGKRMATFPAYNPYSVKACAGCEYRRTKNPKNDQCAACKVIQEMAGYTVHPTTKGTVRIHERHGKNERRENLNIATYLANKYGYDIDLLENIEEKKTADTYNRTIGTYQEYKRSETATKNSIDRLLRNAKKQAGDIVLSIESEIKWEDLTAALRPRVKRSDSISYVTIIRNGKDRRYSREEILKDGFKIHQADLK